MIASFATSLMVMLCAVCATPSLDPQASLPAAIQIESPRPTDASEKGTFASESLADMRQPLLAGAGPAQSAWAGSEIAARLEALDLTSPAPVRAMRGDLWSAEISFGALAERTGLGLDLSITPRARIHRNAAGVSATRAGAEIRFGVDLIARDQRGTSAPAPSWYVFVGAENEALVWNLADRRALDGVALRNQATVGDLQAGVAWTTTAGGQISLGLVERRLRFDDPTGENDLDRKDRFAALSFTLHH